jgi:hypothetical protein
VLSRRVYCLVEANLSPKDEDKTLLRNAGFHQQSTWRFNEKEYHHHHIEIILKARTYFFPG